MKFTLKVYNQGKSENWFYDNSTSQVWNSNGEEMFPLVKPLEEDVKPFDRDSNPNKKCQENYLLEISLGAKCNFHCKYCSQTLYRDLAYSCSPKDVDPFIEKLKKANLHCWRIQLWGGEPLVYWKVIEKLVPKLRELYPDAHISAPSNGSLLTRDKVDFLKKYNMYLYISHDGCGNEKRGKDGNNDDDILKNPVVMDAIRYAQETLPENYIAFNATPSSGNANSEKIIKWFKKTVGPKTKVATHNIVRCHNSLDEEGAKASFINPKELYEYSDSVFDVLNDGDQVGGRSMNGDYSLWRKREGLMFSILNKEPFNSIWAECMLPSPHGIITNMKGEVLQCHNHPIQEHTYGHIDDLSSINSLGYNHLSNKERCRNCLVAHSCKGGCPSADDKANLLACPNLYALHWGIFRAAFASLFGIYVYDYVEKQDVTSALHQYDEK